MQSENKIVRPGRAEQLDAIIEREGYRKHPVDMLIVLRDMLKPQAFAAYYGAVNKRPRERSVLDRFEALTLEIKRRKEK